MFCRSLFVLFLLAIVLSVLIRFISDYPFDNFKPFIFLGIIYQKTVETFYICNIYNFLYVMLYIIMLSVNFFCNTSSYDILAYITKNYIALIYYAKIVHLLCQFHAGKVGFSAVCQAIYS